MKVFIGFENISSTVSDIQKYFNENGHECFVATSNFPPAVQLNTSNFVLQKEFEKIPYFPPKFISIKLRSWWEKRVRRKLIEFALKKFDVFIIIWTSFNYDFSDIEILKAHNKKIVFVFVGDDARWRPAASQEYRMFGLNELPRDEDKFYSKQHLERNLTRIRYAEKYADMIFSRIDQGQLHLRPYLRWNMMANPENYAHNSKQRKNPIIVHAPTAKTIKGTKYVLEAFEQLKTEGVEFTVILVENMPHNEAIKVYQNADIIVDQLFIPGTGKVSTEALAMGKVVISLMAYDKYPQKNPSDCPIIDANAETFYNVLKELIFDYDKRVALADKGKGYVEKYLLPKYFCDLIINEFENNTKSTPEYYPDFFRNYFKPEKEFIDLYNNWSHFVSNMEWYKKTIKKGEREGLIF
ncbi:MAG: glycosyltransferase [Bacteroidetes bacterium]|nr:glycosyltransferase [Bacteroidota bacterium]